MSARTGFLHLEANDAGPGVLRYEPELGRASQPMDMYAYLHPEDGYANAVADFADVPVETVLATGSILQQLDQVAYFTKATDIVALQFDFRGYPMIARRRELPFIAVEATSGSSDDIYERLGNAVRFLRHPLVILTVGASNPLQTKIDAARAVAVVRAANPHATIVLDTAYIDYLDISHAAMARLALEVPGVIVVNPCSKSHFIAGGAVGWMITGDPILDRFARLDDFPFRAPGGGCRMMMRLFQKPECTERARMHVCEARDITLDTVLRYGGPEHVIRGPGPWVLWDAQALAADIVAGLKADQILVQQQGGGVDMLPRNWIRVSATVPDEAETFARSLDHIMAGLSKAHCRA